MSFFLYHWKGYIFRNKKINSIQEHARKCFEYIYWVRVSNSLAFATYLFIRFFCIFFFYTKGVWRTKTNIPIIIIIMMVVVMKLFYACVIMKSARACRRIFQQNFFLLCERTFKWKFIRSRSSTQKSCRIHRRAAVYVLKSEMPHHGTKKKRKSCTRIFEWFFF